MDTLNLILCMGALVALTLCLLLRSFLSTCLSYAELPDRLDLSWKQYRPLNRLLDPNEFQFLRDRGIPEARIRKLKAERRSIFRLCIRSLARDFNSMHRALSAILLQSEADRPDLAAELAKQRITFYRNLARVELYLVLHAWGFERMPSIDLLQPLRGLSAQLREWMPATAAAY